MDYHFTVHPDRVLHGEERLLFLGTEAEDSWGQGAMHANLQENV